MIFRPNIDQDLAELSTLIDEGRSMKGPGFPFGAVVQGQIMAVCAATEGLSAVDFRVFGVVTARWGSDLGNVDGEIQAPLEQFHCPADDIARVLRLELVVVQASLARLAAKGFIALEGSEISLEPGFAAIAPALQGVLFRDLGERHAMSLQLQAIFSMESVVSRMEESREDFADDPTFRSLDGELASLLCVTAPDRLAELWRAAPAKAYAWLEALAALQERQSRFINDTDHDLRTFLGAIFKDRVLLENWLLPEEAPTGTSVDT